MKRIWAISERSARLLGHEAGRAACPHAAAVEYMLVVLVFIFTPFVITHVMPHAASVRC